jgi:hypothetical protein
MIGHPKQWRLYAARCLRGAESASSLETREEFTALAHIWLRRAAEFESDLLNQLNQQRNTLPNEVKKLPVDGQDISVPPRF